MNGSVLIYSAHHDEPEHERACHIDLGRRLSCILGRDFEGYQRPQTWSDPEPPYVVAANTIVGNDLARQLGIEDESQLFGGVAPYDFVATRAIAHPVVHPFAEAPEGWSHEFGRQVRRVVLHGYTAFSLKDAEEAGRQLLERGPVRMKPITPEQSAPLDAWRYASRTVHSVKELYEALEHYDDASLRSTGMVLEEHLEQLRDYTVGQLRVAGVLTSYIGTRQVTTGNDGEPAHGGSDLIFVRGGYGALLDLRLDLREFMAVAEAQLYDAAAQAAFPGLLASRRNYEIACGVAATGLLRCGVFKQSWRPDEASAAEILALEAFHARPELDVIQAGTLIQFGDREAPPKDAIELFSGVDRALGPIRKFAMLKRYEPPAEPRHTSGYLLRRA